MICHIQQYYHVGSQSKEKTDTFLVSTVAKYLITYRGTFMLIMGMDFWSKVDFYGQ